MPAVTENRLKGNYGAALVVSRLSGECLVRPVAAETDVGVDLYCETDIAVAVAIGPVAEIPIPKFVAEKGDDAVLCRAFRLADPVHF